MTRRRSARPTTSSTSAPAPACMAARSSPGHPGEIAADPASLTGQYLSGAREIAVPAERRKGNKQDAERGQGHGQQPEGRHRRLPAGQVHLRHRRLGRRQVDPDHRDALQDRRDAAERGAADPGALRDDQGARTSRQGHRHRPVARSGARRGPTPRPTPAPSRRSATGSPACRRPRRAATSPGGSASTSRAGAARPARATASSRSRCTSCPMSTSPASLQGQALQPRDAGGQFKGKSIADVLDMTVEDAQEFFKAVPAIRDKMDDADAGRAGLHQGRPAGDDPVGRRGAAGEAVQGAVEALHRPHALHSRRTDHGLHFEDVPSCWKCCTNWWTRATRWW
jgi:excinuclease ABC subunit A